MEGEQPNNRQIMLEKQKSIYLSKLKATQNNLHQPIIQTSGFTMPIHSDLQKLNKLLDNKSQISAQPSQKQLDTQPISVLTLTKLEPVVILEDLNQKHSIYQHNKIQQDDQNSIISDKSIIEEVNSQNCIEQFQQETQQDINKKQTIDNKTQDQNVPLDKKSKEKQLPFGLSQEDSDNENESEQNFLNNVMMDLTYLKIFDSYTLEGQDIKEFMMKPAPKGYFIQLQIKRDKSGIKNKFFPKFYLYTNKDYRLLASSVKKPYNKTSNYGIYYHKSKDIKENLQIGKVRGNFMGTEFHIFDDGKSPKDAQNQNEERKILAGIIYDYNFFGTKGPRRMRILHPDATNYPLFEWRYNIQKETLIDQYRTNSDKLQMYHNKQPKWDENYNAYVLNFQGRVDKPSVKNFQIVDEYNENQLYLQFGRQAEDMFSLDFTYPFSPIESFGIALSSFDFKLACE